MLFCDDAACHVLGHVNCHDVQICATGNPRATHERMIGGQKKKVSCGLVHNRVLGPYFLCGKTIRWSVYLHILELEELQPFVIFQHEITPPHYSDDVCWHLLMEHVLANGLGVVDQSFGRTLSWYHAFGLFLWECVKDYVYMLSEGDIATLGARIIETIRSVAKGMLTRTWTELVCQLSMLTWTKTPYASWFTEQLTKKCVFYLFWLSFNKNFKIRTWL